MTSLPSLLLDCLSCRLVTSAVRCRLATRVTLRQPPSLSSFVQLSLVPLPTSGRVEIAGSGLCLGSSAWRTTYIVLQIFEFASKRGFRMQVFKVGRAFSRQRLLNLEFLSLFLFYFRISRTLVNNRILVNVILVYSETLPLEHRSPVNKNGKPLDNISRSTVLLGMSTKS